MCDNIINHKNCGYFKINKEKREYSLNQRGIEHLYGRNYLSMIFVLSSLNEKENVIYIYNEETIECKYVSEFISKLKKLRQRISPIKCRSRKII